MLSKYLTFHIGCFLHIKIICMNYEIVPRERLRAVFTDVIVVDVLDSRDATHLALLQRPELGITFTKIHCWGLTQFEKCVFLDADTLVSNLPCIVEKTIRIIQIVPTIVTLWARYQHVCKGHINQIRINNEDGKQPRYTYTYYKSFGHLEE